MRKRSVRWPLLAVLFVAPAIALAGEQPPCQLGGVWAREDNVQQVELYQVDSRWFGRLVSSTEKDAKPGFVMFKDFAYDGAKDRYKGTVIVPSSGMQASADLVCTSDGHFKVTAHKFLITKSFGFRRVASR